MVSSVLPNIMTLRCDQDLYLGFIKSNRYLLFSRKEKVTSPYVKWEVEPATGPDTAGLVHIRSCLSNKYWERTKISGSESSAGDTYLIAATANKKDEGKEEESSTLFQPIMTKNRMIQIKHVQSRSFVRMGDHTKGQDEEFYMSVSSKSPDKLCDFVSVDLGSLVVLPKYVAFKGYNGLHLRRTWGNYLQCWGDYVGEKAASCEIVVHHDGDISIKQIDNNQFWVGDGFIKAGSDTSGGQNIFRPVKIDDSRIALKHVASNKFCKVLSTCGFIDALNASDLNIDKYAILMVEEHVIRREIIDVKYKLDDSRVYGSEVLVLTSNVVCNHGNEEATFKVKLSFSLGQTGCWNRAESFTVGAKAGFSFGIPYIGERNVEISPERHHAEEWGKSYTTTTNVEDEYNVLVPPMTAVTVKVIATNAMYDVPFSFSQKETLYDGSIVKTEVEGGIYKGANYYNVTYDSEFYPIMKRENIHITYTTPRIPK